MGLDLDHLAVPSFKISFMRIAGLILAAGESSRLGRPKQLVKYKGNSLLNHAINTLLETGINDVFVVLGANRNRIASSIHSSEVITIYNDQWRDGMGSSLSAGIRALEFDDQIEAVLVILSDQPKITAAHYNALVSSSKEKEQIVCSAYDGAIGVPAIFPRSCFRDLKALTGDKGARPVIDSYENKISIPCADCGIDIDTPDDLINLQ